MSGLPKPRSTTSRPSRRSRRFSSSTVAKTYGGRSPTRRNSIVARLQRRPVGALDGQVLFDRQSVHAGAAMQLFANAFDPDSNAALTYDWDFDDGSPPSTVASPLHTYAAVEDTKFLATVEVTDSDGAAATQSVARLRTSETVHRSSTSRAPLLRPPPTEDIDMTAKAKAEPLRRLRPGTR